MRTINRVLFIQYAKDDCDTDCAWIPPGELEKSLKKITYNFKKIKTKQGILILRFPQASIVYRFVFSLHLLTNETKSFDNERTFPNLRSFSQIFC